MNNNHSLRVRVSCGGFESRSEYSSWVSTLELPTDGPNDEIEKDGTELDGVGFGQNKDDGGDDDR